MQSCYAKIVYHEKLKHFCITHFKFPLKPAVPCACRMGLCGFTGHNLFSKFPKMKNGGKKKNGEETKNGEEKKNGENKKNCGGKENSGKK